ncbi:hypothetical protein BpHYR1_023210 [Brachionus plicatilis]|uniref:Uncharacterized protein n=1 Tax=Brachionus plicatilis TaxID=10195 RepID=A0A3M7PTR2_BRAPC|nr:hypothetical protein BpHYR1_023210 [Brachionus plicatilis]
MLTEQITVKSSWQENFTTLSIRQEHYRMTLLFYFKNIDLVDLRNELLANSSLLDKIIEAISLEDKAF